MSTSKWHEWLMAGLSERCALCDTRTSRVALCPYCEHTLTPVTAPCPVCALPTPSGFCAHPRNWQLQSLRAPFVYSGSASRLIGRLKFDRQRWLGQLLGELVRPYACAARSFDLYFPVPLHRRRLIQRGFNQALEISRGALPGVATATGLDRVVDTPPQSQLGAQQRRRNLAGCFRLTRAVDQARVLLIDDVVTTGSTLNALAKLLRHCGAAEVHGLAFARAMGTHTVRV